MATDQSPTQNKAILSVALIIVVTLFGLKFGFDSYFVQMSESAAKEKLPAADQLNKHRASEAKALAAGPMNIDQAMAELGRGGRTTTAGIGRGVDLTPKPSDDKGALIGWSKMPRAVPEAPVAAPAPAAHDVVPTAIDGGAPASDAAAPAADGGGHATGQDGGAAPTNLVHPGH
jgi:hypothetical protein